MKSHNALSSLPQCGMQRHAGGFTLIEALIAFIVLSIGLLGLASLQLNTLQSSHSAYQRTIASVIAIDAGERLWMQLAIDQNLSNINSGWIDDLNTYWENSDITLPDLDIAISCNNTNACEITVAWAEDRFQAEDAQASSFTYSIKLLPDRS